MTLTADDEINAMRRRWPDFRATAIGQSIVIFRGRLAPLRQAYDVRVLYGPKSFLGRLRLSMRQPRVEVLSPPLVEQHPATGMPVPHVYANGDNPKSPLLCLYDPATDEWRPGITAIAETIVPWAAHWLACYEGWLATGKWTGGGRHPPRQSNGVAGTGGDPTNNHRSIGSRLRTENVAEILGTYGSRPLMAHATTKPSDLLDTAESQFIHQALVLAGLAGLEAEMHSHLGPAKGVRNAA